MASNESENFYRIVTLLVNVGTQVLRKLFLKYVQTSANQVAPSSIQDVVVYLINRQSVLMKLVKKKILRQDQLNLLMPNMSGTVDPESWDISLFAVILKNICPISPNEFTEIGNLQRIRNVIYGHANTATMTYSDYINHKQAIEGALKTLMQVCNEAAFETEMMALIQKVHTGSLDIGGTVQILTQWYIEDKVKECQLDNIDNKMTDLLQQVTEIKGAFKKQANPVFLKLKKHTATILEQEKGGVPFVPTSQYEKANQMLTSDHVVVILGGPGVGKTTTAKQLITSNNLAEQCLVLNDPNQWEHVDLEEIDVILIDDIFGKFSFNKKRLDQWITVLDMIQSAVLAKNIKLIIVTRDVLYEQCKTALTRYDMFQHKIEISTALLSDKEKGDILGSFISTHGYQMSQESCEACCKVYSLPFGFLTSCELFVSSKDIFARGEHFFNLPIEYFKEICDNLPRLNYLCLVLLFYKRNKIIESDLKPKRRVAGVAGDSTADFMSLLKYIAECVNENPQTLAIAAVRDTLTSMLTWFLKLEDKTFSFINDSIYDCVALIYGETYPEEVIENCSLDFMHKRIRIGDICESTYLTIVKEDSDILHVLSERIIKEIIDFESVSDIVKHQAFHNREFCCCLTDALKSSDQVREFLGEFDQNEEKSFLMQFLKNNDDDLCSVLLEIIQSLLQHNSTTILNVDSEEDSDKTTTNTPSCVCWKCSLNKAALNWCIQKGYKKCSQLLS